MAEISNLRQARKRKRRADKERDAEANRLRFGRSAAAKAGERLDRDLAERRLEGHRRDPSGGSDPQG